MKLLRTIRLDPSDTFVFATAAEPGEWAVSGAFLFAEVDPDTLSGKERVAFRSGFLGVSTFGWSTLVQVVSALDSDRADAIEKLARQLMQRLGAPDLDAARAAAEAEIAFAASLCEHDAGTVIAVHRAGEDDSFRETFRTIRPREGEKPMRAFAFLEVEGESEAGEDVNIVGLAGGAGS